VTGVSVRGRGFWAVLRGSFLESLTLRGRTGTTILPSYNSGRLKFHRSSADYSQIELKGGILWQLGKSLRRKLQRRRLGRRRGIVPKWSVPTVEEPTA